MLSLLGAGLGYQAAMLRAVGFSKVTAVEIRPDLSRKASEIFADDPNVEVVCKDGKKGMPGQKFDAIVVAAQTSESKTMACFMDMLKIGGKLVMPVDASLLKDLLSDVKFGLEEKMIKPNQGLLITAIRNRTSFDFKLRGYVDFVRLV